MASATFAAESIALSSSKRCK
uniref:Uncharacterized protein n=1 Tax=Anguilla anguilla TaxID=7936 RepID=A0A0E9VIF9_ANGAN